MPEDHAPADMFAILDDEYARAILKLTNTQPMSAPQLAATLDISRPTVYRRIEQLQSLNLLSETTDIDADGHHRGIYQARLDRVIVDLTDDQFSIRINRSDHPADRFTDVWEGI